MTPIQFYKCLADETRLKSLLLIAEQGEACVCDLMAALELDQPKVSRHLAQLRQCAIVADERRGKWVYYRLHPELAQWASQVLTQTGQANPDYIAAERQRFVAARSSNSCPN
ncbi:Arsenical resistance operon repressor [Saliniradius amylolyticus]|uniref:Arsenical resistance operon repressor n=1 Tax=Saliniradius amylolyticus TaxID=2183582 RepID=A0A2S2E1B6_9ALTE|nr:metalloregulator ArsR/SmtB family transcription factor [Saliniradius amylolyticus]AWL10827.1 Arsenical resistance operon repressor [Saliniradius amylolyticus]